MAVLVESALVRTVKSLVDWKEPDLDRRVSPSNDLEVGEEGCTVRCEPSLAAEGADILSDCEEEDCSWFEESASAFEKIVRATYRCDN